MEDGSEALPSKNKRKLPGFFVILLVPVFFGFITWNLGNFAYEYGLFYTPPNRIKQAIFLTIPLTAIYLWLRKTNLRIAKPFALNAISVLLIGLSALTIYETNKYESIENISEEFILPEGWVEASEVSKYQSFGNLWKKNDEGNPLTAEDLQKIALDNNIKNYTMMGSCNPEPPYLGCSLYGGDIEGQEVELKYFDSTYPESDSRITLYIRDISPPRGYMQDIMCSDEDLVGELVSRPCSPWEIAKYRILY